MRPVAGCDGAEVTMPADSPLHPYEDSRERGPLCVCAGAGRRDRVPTVPNLTESESESPSSGCSLFDDWILDGEYLVLWSVL